MGTPIDDQLQANSLFINTDAQFGGPVTVSQGPFVRHDASLTGDGSLANPLSAVAAPPSSNPAPGFYGFAELGDVTLNGGGPVSTESIGPQPAGTLFFRNLTITNNTELRFDPSNSETVVAIFVDGTLTITPGSSITNNGNPGDSGGASNGGAAPVNTTASGGAGVAAGGGPASGSGGLGQGSRAQFSVLPKKAGDGGQGDNVNIGGAGATCPDAIAWGARHLIGRPLSIDALIDSIGPASAQIGDTIGGGGGGNASAVAVVGSGAGGSGGGILLIVARHVFDGTTQGTLPAGSLVARGGNGGNAGAADIAGGGGGGLGGVVIVATQDTTLTAACANVAGGTGGTPGAAPSTAGQAGSTGEIIISTPAATTWTH